MAQSLPRLHAPVVSAFVELSLAHFEELAEVALRAATEAGEMIVRSRPAEVQHKAGAATLASQVVTEIDRAADAMIVEALTPTLESYQLGILTEETPDGGGRLTADYHWCVDPLDGTLVFIEGDSGYSVSIALVRNDGVPCIGVVYDPVSKTTYHAIAGGGIWRNGQPWSPAQATSGDELLLFVTSGFAKRADHDELLGRLEQLALDLGFGGVRIDPGSGAVMKACQVLEQPPGCFVIMPGPTGASLWDFAATACLFAEAGASATRFDGARLDLNRADSTNFGSGGVLYATDATLAEQVRKACGHDA